MSIQASPYPLRIDRDVMEKIKLIAKLSGRSVNKEIEFQLRQIVKDYEASHGPLLSEGSE
mgnify:CR=1 FL=1